MAQENSHIGLFTLLFMKFFRRQNSNELNPRVRSEIEKNLSLYHIIKKLHSILFVAESDENTFQSRKKNFSGHFIKVLATLELQNRAQKNAFFLD